VQGLAREVLNVFLSIHRRGETRERKRKKKRESVFVSQLALGHSPAEDLDINSVIQSFGP
jgi:hypothetical protein